MSKGKDQPISIGQMTDIHLLAGGGVPLQPDLFQTALSLLNDENIHLEQLMKDPTAKYLYEHLKKRTKIIPPLSFLIDDNDEDKGKSSFTFFIIRTNILATYTSNHTNQDNLCYLGHSR